MELFKGLTQEEIKELRSIIVLIGIIIELGSRQWQEYVHEILNLENNLSMYTVLSDLLNKTDQEIELIIRNLIYFA